VQFVVRVARPTVSFASAAPRLKTALIGSVVPFALLLLGCASSLPVPGPTDVKRASALWPETTERDLADGRELFVNHCSNCHTLPMPNQYARGRWPAFVDEMAKEAHLDTNAQAKVTRYLMVMAPP
jgi:mono/diheme cytochrome c family protein